MIQNLEYRKQHARSLYYKYCNEQKAKKNPAIVSLINYIYDRDLHFTKSGIREIWENILGQKIYIASIIKLLIICDVITTYVWENTVFYEPRLFKPAHVHLVCDCGRMWEYGGDALKDFAGELMSSCGAILQAPAFCKVVCPCCQKKSYLPQSVLDHLP